MALKEFGDFISQKLVERRIKRKDLATRIGVGQNTISGWVSGNHRPEDKYISLLAVALEVSELELLKRLTPDSTPDKLQQVANIAAIKFNRKKLKNLLGQLSIAGMDVTIKEEDINPNLVALEQIKEMENAIDALLKAHNNLLSLSDAMVDSTEASINTKTLSLNDTR